MADEPKIKINQLDVYENLPNNNELVVYQGDSTGPRKEQRIPPSCVGVLNGLKLNASRIAMQELISGTLSVSGWWTIAELDDISSNQGISQFNIKGNDGLFSIEVALRTTSSARTKANTTIEIKSKAFFGASTASDILGFRIAKSDSVGNAGAKIQVNIGTSTVLTTQINGNNGGNAGWELITPTQIDIGLLPDGVTAATFLEAGAELSLPTDGSIFGARKLNNDVIAVTLEWHEIPKQGTGLTITLPSTNLTVVGGDGVGTSFSTVTFTISNFSINGKFIYFRMNETGKFTSINSGGLQLNMNGTGGKLIIS